MCPATLGDFRQDRRLHQPCSVRLPNRAAVALGEAAGVGVIRKLSYCQMTGTLLGSHILFHSEDTG